jgi:hypothetical protein
MAPQRHGDAGDFTEKKPAYGNSQKVKEKISLKLGISCFYKRKTLCLRGGFFLG